MHLVLTTTSTELSVIVLKEVVEVVVVVVVVVDGDAEIVKEGVESLILLRSMVEEKTTMLRS